MKLLLISFIVILFAFNVNSQSASTTASGTVNIILPLSITSTGGSLDFGDIILTGTTTSYQISPIQGQYFQVTGHPGRSVSIIFNSVILSNEIWVGLNGGTVGTLPFTPEVVTGQNTAVSSGNFYPLFPHGLTGLLDIRVGGSIDISANQPDGNYIGTFTISVSY